MSSHAEFSVNESLLNAFLATDYCVDIDEERLCVEIGQCCPALDAAAGQHSWVLITAFNPGAEQLDEGENLARHNELKAVVEDAGLPAWPSIHRARDGNWPDEHGLLVIDAPSEWVHHQARRFGQVGVVHGGQGQPAELWLYQDLDGQDAQAHVRRMLP